MLENSSMLASRGIHSGALVVMGWVRLGCEIERVARWHQAVAPSHGSASTQRSPTALSGIGRRPFQTAAFAAQARTDPGSSWVSGLTVAGQLRSKAARTHLGRIRWCRKCVVGRETRRGVTQKKVVTPTWPEWRGWGLERAVSTLPRILAGDGGSSADQKGWRGHHSE